MDNLVRIAEREVLYVPSIKEFLYNARGPIDWSYNGKEEPRFKLIESEKSKRGIIAKSVLVLDEHGRMFGSIALDRTFKYFPGQGVPKRDPAVTRFQFLWENSEDPSIMILYRRGRILKEAPLVLPPTRFPKCTPLVVWHHKEHKYFEARYLSKVRGEDRYWVMLLHEEGKSENEVYDIDQAIYKAFPPYCRTKK
jgi:hypothetical protein